MLQCPQYKRDLISFSLLSRVQTGYLTMPPDRNTLPPSNPNTCSWCQAEVRPRGMGAHKRFCSKRPVNINNAEQRMIQAIVEHSQLAGDLITMTIYCVLSLTAHHTLGFGQNNRRFDEQSQTRCRRPTTPISTMPDLTMT